MFKDEIQGKWYTKTNVLFSLLKKNHKNKLKIKINKVKYKLNTLSKEILYWGINNKINIKKNKITKIKINKLIENIFYTVPNHPFL